MTNPQQPRRKAQAVADDFDFGIYMFQFHDGSYLSDGEGNYLNIEGMKFDLQKMNALNNEVRSYGIDMDLGKVVFVPGLSRATEEEYEEDKARFAQGLTPYGDFGAFKDGNKSR
jgi:hypothetical protein